MATPEFVSIPEWFKVRCANTDHAPCAACPREFVISSHYVKAIHKAKDGRAYVLLNSANYCPMPQCEGRLMFIETQMQFDAFIAGLPGKVTDLGNVEMVALDYVNRG